MTSSRSRTSTSSVIVALILTFVGWVLFAPSISEAGRKRVVVLELDGPKADKFHDGLIKLLQRTHTVVPLEKWNSTADDLGATRQNDKDIKKVAKKLKIDAVVFGKVDKRRDEYIISLQIRAGRSGQVVGNRIDTKAEGPRIDGKASRDLKDELVDAISSLESAKSSGGDDDDDDEDEDEKPAKKSTKKSKDDDEDEDDEDEKPAKKGFSKKSKDDDEDEEEDEKPAKKALSKKSKDDDEDEDEDEKPAKKGFSRKDDDTTEDEDENPLPKSSKKKQDANKDDDEDDEDEDSSSKKRVASSDDDDEDSSDGDKVEEDADVEEMDAEQALSLAERGIDVVLGLSFNMRRMAFTYDGDLASKPPPYKGVPVAGIYIDGTVFPLAVGHTRRDMLKNLGLTVMYDRVLKIESKSMGMPLPTAQARYAVGVAFRYPVGDKAVIGARLRYGRQNFTIGTVNGIGADIPNVHYTIIDPAVTFAYQANPKLAIDGKLAFMAITNTGAIQKNDQYGAATVKGFEGELGGSYSLTKNIFARASFKLETIGFEFGGNGMLATGRDSDPEQDVQGARDSYYGGSLAIGVLY